MTTTTSGKNRPVEDETRWTEEGGSNQHYRHDDETTDQLAWQAFAPREDRTWKKFEATYGSRFAASVKPCSEKDKP